MARRVGPQYQRPRTSGGTNRRRDGATGRRKPERDDFHRIDALGNLIRFVLLPGQRHDITKL
jgi:hypothetical protein